jgi:hypothetical protein
MKTVAAGLALIITYVISVGGFLDDQIEQRLGKFGVELRNSVATAGELQIFITRLTQTEADVVRHRNEILRRLVDLREQVEQITLALALMDIKPLSVKGLDDRERIMFVNWVSSATNRDYSKDNAFDVSTIKYSYSILEKNLIVMISNYEKAIKEFRGGLNPFAQRQFGVAGADLTISVGELVQFAGFISRMALAE